MKYKTGNKEETYKLGHRFGASLKGGETLALYGGLGAGKTTLVSGIINYFIPGVRVLSPTFIIVRHYYPQLKNIKHLVHADLYRLENDSQIIDLGLEDFFCQPSSVVLIEWAEKMKKILPKDRIDVHLKVVSQSVREINYGRQK